MAKAKGSGPEPQTNEPLNAIDRPQQWSNEKNTTVDSPLIEMTFRGSEASLRSVLHNMRFVAPWNIGVARRIALDESLEEDAVLDDTLDGPKIKMFSQDDRDIYKDRCCQAAAHIGHPVPPSKQGNIKVDEGTTIREVARTLNENANR